MSTSSQMAPKAKLKRKGHSKTKSGCKTCRKRRVKCGEEKPSCIRCIKYGITCDWDPIKGQEKYCLASIKPKLLPKDLDIVPSSTRPLQKRTVLLPKINLLAPLLPNPSRSLFTNQEEHHYFEVFASKTAFEILPSFDSGTLRQILLQACVTEPSIRHAVVALGALDKTAGSLEVFGSITGDKGRSYPAEHHQNALKQYAMAIKYMRAAALTCAQDLRTTLVTCLVIFCFEAWDGLKENAVKQVQTGLNLIQDWRDGRNTTQESSANTTTIIEDDLVRAFSRLDVQAISFAAGEGRSPERLAAAAKQERNTLGRMPSVFTTVQDAESYESMVLRRTMRFIAFDVPLPKLPRPLLMFPVNGWWGERSTRVVAIQESISKDIMRWQVAFEPLWKRMKAKQDPNLMIAAMLQMHLNCALTALIQICIDDEEKWDDYTSLFIQIVELAEYSLHVLEAAKSSSAKFQFDSHVVIPLHMVGHKCRDRTIRRRAISLLLSHPRREGVWDSSLAGGMAEWAMSVEEEHLENGQVPGWARIHGVVLDRGDGSRKIIWTCEQRLGPHTDEFVTRRKSILW